MPENPRLEDLRAEAAYARNRRDLYRAKAYGVRPTSAQRMRDLDRAVEQAEQRLAHAQRVARGDESAEL